MIAIEDFKQALRNGVVNFRFTKKDGSIREANGTLNKEVIDEACANPNGGEFKAKASGYVAYFDVDEEDWRCFHPDNLIEESIKL